MKQVIEYLKMYLGATDFRSLRDQVSPDILSKDVYSLKDAIMSFTWNETVEGFDYWDSRHQAAVNMEELEKNPSIADNNDPFYKAKGYFPKRPFPREKKIVGYKTPFDLFDGRIKKGSIFSEYSPKKLVMYSKDHTTTGVPTEIVHSWEPVYEEHNIQLVVGTPQVTVTITRDSTIEAKGQQVQWGLIERIKNDMTERCKIGVWKVSYPQVVIGCSKFSKEDIVKIWESFAKLNNKQI